MTDAPLKSLPRGFSFRPTDEELINHYLKRKITGEILSELVVIPEINVHKCDPWDLPDKALMGSDGAEWFFFAPIDRKYPTGSRSNRATKTGYWKAMGKDRAIRSQGPTRQEAITVGMRKTLVFYKRQAPHGERTNWIMHEYRFSKSEYNSGIQGGYVLCKLFRKTDNRAPGQAYEAKLTNVDEADSSGFSPDKRFPGQSVEAELTNVDEADGSGFLPDEAHISDFLQDKRSPGQAYEAELTNVDGEVYTSGFLRDKGLFIRRPANEVDITNVDEVGKSGFWPATSRSYNFQAAMDPSALQPLLSHIEASASAVLSAIELGHLHPGTIDSSYRLIWVNIRKSLQNLRYCSTRSSDLLKYEAENEADRQDLLRWFGKANEMAYVALDVLIEFEFTLDECKVSGWGSDEVGQKRKISEVVETDLYSALSARHLTNFSERLHHVCLRFNSLLADHTRSFLFLRVVNQNVTQYHQRNLSKGQTVMGREVEREKLISLLLPSSSDNNRTDNALALVSSPSGEPNAHNVTLVCVVGESGIGKTSLIHTVYNDCTLLGAFDVMLWVSMSEMINESSLLKEMIECITHQPCGIIESSVLHEIVKEELNGKRFLLVLDDAENENESFWSNFLAFLEIGAQGSFVLVSTSSRKVVAATGTESFLYLDPLSMKNSWLMFSQFGFHRVVGFSLREACKKLVARFSGFPLYIKMFSWVLCSLHNEEFIEAVSLNKLWDIDEIGGGILPALRVFYDLLPTCLKHCLKYCSLFPKNFIFEKDHMVRLWISQGFIDPTEGMELEEIGTRCFDELLDRSFFEKFLFHNAKEDKFVMHEHIYYLVRHVSREEYFLSDNCLKSAPANTKHFSIAPNELETKEISMVTKDVSDLETFYVANRSAAQWNSTFSPMALRPLHSLLMKFKNLKTLNLSGTDIEELPESIQLLKHLCYLGLNATKIKILPVAIVNLVNLLTLEAKNCCHLSELPKNVIELSNLRHLDVRKNSGFIKMPCGIGRLTNLHTLSVLYVGDGISNCSIGEMKNLDNVRGSLQIAGLENIESGNHAKEANLATKKFVQSLVLEWNGDGKHINYNEVAFEVLEGLMPNNHLEELIIRNYPGIQFPMWVEDSKFSNLVSVIVDNCSKNVMFPSLGMLPSLRYLSVRKMLNLKKMGHTRFGWEILPSFPSLELLNLQEMHRLEELFEIEDGDFPCLRTLSISRCLMLKSIPCFPSLLQLTIHLSNRLPEISCLPSLELLKIEGFYKARLLSLPHNLPRLKKLEINHCNELVSVEGLPWLTSISNVKVNRCPKLRVDEIWKKQNIKMNTTRDCNKVEEMKVFEAYPRTNKMAESFPSK